MLDVKKERKKSGRNISLLAYQTFNLPAFHFYSPCWPIRSAPGHIIAEGQRGEVRGFPRKDPVQALPPLAVLFVEATVFQSKTRQGGWQRAGIIHGPAYWVAADLWLAERILLCCVALHRRGPLYSARRRRRRKIRKREERERARRGTCQPCEICTHISMARISIATTANWLRL